MVSIIEKPKVNWITCCVYRSEIVRKRQKHLNGDVDGDSNSSCAV